MKRRIHRQVVRAAHRPRADVAPVDAPQGDGDVYLPPRDDINAPGAARSSSSRAPRDAAPDLYIPSMAFVSYVLVVVVVVAAAAAAAAAAAHQREFVQHVRVVDIKVVLELAERLVVLQLWRAAARCAARVTADPVATHAAFDEAIAADQLLAVGRRRQPERRIDVLRLHAGARSADTDQRARPTHQWRVGKQRLHHQPRNERRRPTMTDDARR